MADRVKNTLIFHHDWVTVLMADLDDHESMTLIRALIQSHETGEIVDIGNDRLMKTIYRKMIGDVAETDRAHEDLCIKRAQQGAKGAAARWGKEVSKEELEKIAEETRQNLAETGRKAVKMKLPDAKKPAEKPKGSLDASIFVSKMSETAAKPEAEPEPKPQERHIQPVEPEETPENWEPDVTPNASFNDLMSGDQEAI